MVDKVDVLQFMMLRAPSVPDSTAFRRSYVRDDVVEGGKRRDEDLFSVNSPSVIGRRVHDAVYCSEGSADPVGVATRNAALVDSVLSEVPSLAPPCPNLPGMPGIGLLQDRRWFKVGESYYLPPDRLVDLETPYGVKLQRLVGLFEATAESPVAGNGTDVQMSPLNLALLHEAVRELFDGMKPHEVVFGADGTYRPDFRLAKRILFDVLYLLYMLRRRVRVDLEPVMDALGALHALEALAIDSLLAELGGVHTHVLPVPEWLVALFPVLAEWDRQGLPEGFPLVGDQASLRAHLDATPVVHPIFARLHRFRHPFNDIAPVGVGDLKVVKQWLLGYRAGEISHIDNVLDGEHKSRVHRHLEKVEEVFTLTSERQEETTRDTQTTDRFEMKREAENVVKSELNAHAGLDVNATVEGQGYTIVSSVTGGVGYTRSQTEQAKVAANFARDVVDRAVKRVQSRVSQQRTTTTLFETEETNTHSLENPRGGGHVSGLYRWVDKVYRSQIYNYGKRMMFEFVLPEPAAFLMESRLRAHEATLEVPQPPKPVVTATLPQWIADLTPAAITPERFRQLRVTHGLDDLEYPQVTRWVEFVDAANGHNYFSESGIESHSWQARTYTCRLGAKDYRIANLVVRGYAYFWGRVGSGEGPDAEQPDINTFEVRVDGRTYVNDVDNSIERWYFGANAGSDHPTSDAPALAGDQVTLLLGFWDIAEFDLSLNARLELDPDVLGAWQAGVIARVRAVEQERVDALNTERHQVYESRLANYRNRIGELRAAAVNDLLQGRSEAFNRQVIVRELKRQCLAALTREFDADSGDDTITSMEAVSERPVKVRYRQMRVTEVPDTETPTAASVAFVELEQHVDFPVPDLPVAREKGRYVQFLEQAFEWQQLSYVFYPYFWATPPKWVDLMNRSDDADPFLTAFLQAGSARVLVAVTPAHDCAVLHYIATGEPWDGGAAPVIGDPLYIPLYEELRRQQDDLANATAEGESWTFTLPTSLVHLEDSSSTLPLPAGEGGGEGGEGGDGNGRA